MQLKSSKIVLEYSFFQVFWVKRFKSIFFKGLLASSMQVSNANASAFRVASTQNSKKYRRNEAQN